MLTNQLKKIKEIKEDKIHNLDGESYFNVLKQIVSDCIDGGFYIASPTSREKEIMENAHNTSTIPDLLSSFSYTMGSECGEALNAMKNDIYSSSSYYVSQEVQAYYDQVKADVVTSLGQIANISIEV